MATTEEPIVSHGRGGQGNIGPDPTEYADGEIHHESDPEAGDKPYLAGRGGAGNVGSPRQGAVNTGADDDIVPEAAIIPQRKEDEAYHSGRGGEGNLHVPEKDKSKYPAHEGLADKLKHKLFKHTKK